MNNSQLADRIRKLSGSFNPNDHREAEEYDSYRQAAVDRFLAMYPPQMLDVQRQIDALFDRQVRLNAIASEIYEDLKEVKQRLEEILEGGKDD